MKKWHIIIIMLVALVIIGTMEGGDGKKDARYSFRCSDDNSTVEIFNKATDGFTTWQACTGGECQYQNGAPTCVIQESKKEESPYNPKNLLVLGALALVVMLIFKNRRK